MTDQDWDNFHKLIGDKVGLEPDQVGALRSLRLKRNMDREAVTRWAEEKMTLHRKHWGQSNTGRRKHRVGFYQKLKLFAELAIQDYWDLILSQPQNAPRTQLSNNSGG